MRKLWRVSSTSTRRVGTLLLTYVLARPGSWLSPLLRVFWLTGILTCTCDGEQGQFSRRRWARQDVVNYPHFRSVLRESVARRHRRDSDATSSSRRSVFASTDEELGHIFRRGQASSCRAVSSGRSRSQSWLSSSRRGDTRPPGANSACKQLVLLPHPSWDSVPRQSAKAKLID